MKKIKINLATFLILLGLTLNLFLVASVPVFAQNSFTSEEAIALYEDAHGLMFALLHNSTSVRVNEEWPYFIVDENNFVDRDEWSPYYKIISYYDGSALYESNTEDKLKQIVGRYYSVDIIDEFLSFIKSYSKSYDIFHVDDGGDVYLIEPGFAPIWWYNAIGSSNLQVNGDKASINLIIERLGTPEIEHYISLPVNYVKTSEGWKLSDIVVDNFKGSNWREYEIENPLTSDPTVVTVAILGTVVVISLALPVVIYKRRRRAA